MAIGAADRDVVTTVVATVTAAGVLRGPVGALAPLAGRDRRTERLNRPLPMVAIGLAFLALCCAIAVAPQDSRGLPAGVVQVVAIIGIPFSLFVVVAAVRRFVQERRRGRHRRR